MPKLCRCGAIVDKRCPKCQPSHSQGNSAKRGYDRQWRKVRERYMQEHPVCEDCEQHGRITAAAQVHHMRTIADAPHLRLDHDNLRSLCVPCHQKTHTPGVGEL